MRDADRFERAPAAGRVLRFEAIADAIVAMAVADAKTEARLSPASATDLRTDADSVAPACPLALTESDAGPPRSADARAGAGLRRILVALVGPPGAGKSHVAARLADALEAARPDQGTDRPRSDAPSAAAAGAPSPGAATRRFHERSASAPFCVVAPMDGFHYDDAILEARALRPRKGAPETFDLGGLATALRRLRRADEDEVALPLFDRDRELSRAGALIVRRETPVVVVEGNYLLLDRPGWRDLRACFDLTVFLDAPDAELRRRLDARWRAYGLSPQAIAEKVEGNDLPNVRLVRSESAAPDLRLVWPDSFAGLAPSQSSPSQSSPGRS